MNRTNGIKKFPQVYTEMLPSPCWNSLYFQRIITEKSRFRVSWKGI